MFARLLSAAAVLAFAAAAQADTARWQTELPTRSLYDAQSLGPGNLRFGMAFGFPYVQVAGGVGLAPGSDIDVNVDTLYGAATQFSVGPKIRLTGDDSFAVAIALEGQWTLFRNASATETDSLSTARHLTGLRNWGIEPQLIASSRGRSGSLFGVMRYQETYASEPEPSAPLSGPGPAWGGNLGFYVGGELNPGSAMVHAYGLAGVDVHLRSTDAPALPRIELGFTFPG